jgi:hypothetical protein
MITKINDGVVTVSGACGRILITANEDDSINIDIISSRCRRKTTLYFDVDYNNTLFVDDDCELIIEKERGKYQNQHLEMKGGN